MTITKKVKLVAGPVAERGTRFRIRIPEDDPAWGIYRVYLSDSATSVKIDWGDGTSSVLSEFEPITHTYARGGEYAPMIEDGIQSLACSGSDSACQCYGSRILTFETNAEKLERLDVRCLYNATALSSVALSAPSLAALLGLAFGGCTALRGRIDLPHISRMPTSSAKMRPFLGCDGITEIHFAAANEAAIRASAAYRTDPKLGAENATVVFDL